MTASPYQPASLELLQEIVRQAEARLDAQLTAALGADQRAMTFAGLLFAGAAALGAAAFAPALAGYLASLLIVCVGWTTAAALATASARPAVWEYVGNIPSAWLSDIAAGRSLHEGLADMAGYYDGMIDVNETAIRKAGRLMHGSMWVALISAVGAPLAKLVF